MVRVCESNIIFQAIRLASAHLSIKLSPTIIRLSPPTLFIRLEDEAYSPKIIV